MAMIVAVMVMLLLTLIPLLMFSQAIQQLPLARHDQDHESALHAAEAGVEDYVNHLNANNNYWSSGNAPNDGNPAFTGWVPVPGPTTTESFRYRVDTSTTLSNGIVYLTASGGSCSGFSSSCPNGRVVRTIKVGLRKTGFLDYLYLTDYEIVDPALSGEPTSSCLFHAWEMNPSTGNYGPDLNRCSVIYMTTQATFNGPVHTNDGFYVCGNPNFNGLVDTYYNSPTSRSVSGQTSFAGSGVYQNKSGCVSAPTFRRAGDPASGEDLQMPPANTSIQTQAALNGATGGCLFTGPTTIALHYTNNTGYMDVTSPKTRTINPSCISAAQLVQLGLGRTVTNVALPPNGVVYVQNIPAAVGNANHSSCSGNACLGDVNISNAASNGGLAGQLTVASDDNVVITGNLTYHTYPGGFDVLGLVATNNVAINHPVDGNGNNASGSVTSPTVDAAILSLKHSFYVQNWAQGATLGTLTVNGVISQQFRGAVGTFNGQGPVTGYIKAYTYDTRLSYLTPPYFLNPILSAWRKLSFAELAPAY
ncbi:MAG: hypothetical protein M3N98_08490 [Actinomycetota bacterium]|nr:hypothetical protein [Actinomycetota bacterium]